MSSQVAPAPAPGEKGSKKSNKPNNRRKDSNSTTAAATAATDVAPPQPRSDDAVLQLIAARSTAMMQPVVTLTIYIPSTAVGAVIGRRGQNISSLQKTASLSAHSTTSCRVSIVGQDSETETVPYTYSPLDWSDAMWTPVVIRADPTAALTAAYKLQSMVDCKIDEVVLDVPVSRTKHAAIVGKRGIQLANMSADTGVRIMLPNKNLRHDVIQLEGDLDSVKNCLARVLQVAAKAKPSKNDNSTGTDSSSGGGGGGHAASNAVTANVNMPQLPSQTKIRSIGRKTDCSIKKKKLDSETWQLLVTGPSTDQVQAAVAILNKWKDDNAVSAAASSSGGAASNLTVQTAGSDSGNAAGGTTPTTAAPSPSRRNNNRGRQGGRGKGTPKRGKGKNSSAADAAAPSS